jgi:hypothetical protein
VNSIKGIFLLTALAFQTSAAQKRAIDKIALQPKLRFRKRQNHHKTKIPEGTTEVVYRITLLTKPANGSSLVSVLKAIPDPTGISQGSWQFYLSKISGDINVICCFSVGLSYKIQRKRKTDDACFIQDTPVSKMPS